jgi:hypothetical protein
MSGEHKPKVGIWANATKSGKGADKHVSILPRILPAEVEDVSLGVGKIPFSIGRR